MHDLLNRVDEHSCNRVSILVGRRRRGSRVGMRFFTCTHGAAVDPTAAAPAPPAALAEMHPYPPPASRHAESRFRRAPTRR
jgi:hypothetical protein